LEEGGERARAGRPFYPYPVADPGIKRNQPDLATGLMKIGLAMP